MSSSNCPTPGPAPGETYINMVEDFYTSSHILASIWGLFLFITLSASLGLLEGMAFNAISKNFQESDHALVYTGMLVITSTSILAMNWFLALIRGQFTPMSSWLAAQRRGTYAFSAGHQIVILTIMVGIYPDHLYWAAGILGAWFVLTVGYWIHGIVTVELSTP